MGPAYAAGAVEGSSAYKVLTKYLFWIPGEIYITNF